MRFCRLYREATDAVNAETLQNALRDDGPAEIKTIIMSINAEYANSLEPSYHADAVKYRELHETGWTENNFDTYLNSFLQSGWSLYKISPFSYGSTYFGTNYTLFLYTLKRTTEE